MKIKRSAGLLCCEVQSVQCLCLSFCNRGNVARSWEPPVTCEAASGILDNEALRCVSRGGLEVKQWAQRVSLAMSSEPVSGKQTVNVPVCFYLLIKSPWFSQSTNKIGASSSKLVIYMPAAGQETLSTFLGLSQRKQGNHIASISVKDLLISGVRRGTNLLRVDLVAQIFDMRKYDIGGLAVDLVVLTTSDWRNVRSNASVNNNVFLTGVVVDGHTAHNFESVAEMYLLGDFAKSVVKFGERECLLRDVSNTQVQCYSFKQ